MTQIWKLQTGENLYWQFQTGATETLQLKTGATEKKPLQPARLKNHRDRRDLTKYFFKSRTLTREIATYQSKIIKNNFKQCT